jgi:hypothetical protein
MAVLILAGGLWEVFAPGSEVAEWSASSGGAWLAFLLIGLVAVRVSAALEAQSREIETLKKRMDQVQLAR